MAIFNEIEANRISRMLQKVFSIRGNAPVRQLAGEVIPVFPLFNGVENRQMENWDRFYATTSVTGGAAQEGAVRIRNPLLSNAVMVLEKVLAASTTLQQIQAQQQSTGVDLPTVFGGSSSLRMDARGKASSAMILSNTTNYAPGAQAHLTTFIGANQGVDFILFEDQEITILPGDDFTVFSGTAAVLLQVSLMWRERMLEDSERK